MYNRRLNSFIRELRHDVTIKLDSSQSVLDERRLFILNASEGDESAVGAFFEQNGNVSGSVPVVSVDDFRVKALRKAAEKGHTAVMRLILRACQDHPLFQRLDIPAWHKAAWTGETATILQELDAGKDVNVETYCGLTALHLASSSGQLDVVQLLLQRWPQVNVDCVSGEGLTALHLAANGGHSAVAKELLEACPEATRGAFLKAQDRLGRSALHYAARKGHDSVVQYLLQAPEQVDLHAKDRVRESTAFLLATMIPGDHVKVVRLLLEKDLNQIGARVGDPMLDETALEQLEKDHDWKVLRPQLVDEADAASVRAQFRVGDYTLEKGEDDADRLKSRGVCIAGHTALHLAASRNNVKVVTYLLEQSDVDVDARDHTFGMTPLHCAVRTGALDVIKVLLKLPQARLDVNAQLLSGGPIPDSEQELEKGDTALHLTIRFGPCTEALASAMELVKLGHLKASKRNESSWVTPLELAWGRWLDANATRSPVPTAPEVLITVISEHPDMHVLVANLKEMTVGMKNSFNGLLLGGTLLAGTTFSGFLQPPSPGEYKEAVKWFWIFNSMSFYFAIYTLLVTVSGLLHSEDAAPMSVTMVSNTLTSYWQMRFQVVGSCLAMVLSILTGMAAFVSVGYANLPPQIHAIMNVSTCLGAYLVIPAALYVMGPRLSSVSKVVKARKSDRTSRMRDLLVFVPHVGTVWNLMLERERARGGAEIARGCAQTAKLLVRVTNQTILALVRFELRVVFEILFTNEMIFPVRPPLRRENRTNMWNLQIEGMWIVFRVYMPAVFMIVLAVVFGATTR